MGIGEKPGKVPPEGSAGEVPIAIPRPGEILQGKLSRLFQIAPCLPLPTRPWGVGGLESHLHRAQKAGGKKEGSTRSKVMFKQVLDLNLAVERPCFLQYHPHPWAAPGPL